MHFNLEIAVAKYLGDTEAGDIEEAAVDGE